MAQIFCTRSFLCFDRLEDRIGVYKQSKDCWGLASIAPQNPRFSSVGFVFGTSP